MLVASLVVDAAIRVMEIEDVFVAREWREVDKFVPGS